MSKFCLLLSVVILVSGFCFVLSHANSVRQSKGHSKVTPKSRRLQTTTQSDYFFDGSGYEESGFDPNFDDEGGDDDDDDYLGSGLDYKTPHSESSPTITTLLSSSTTQQTVFSTIVQVTVDVEPTESPESVTLEGVIQREDVKVQHAAPSANTTEAPMIIITTTSTGVTSDDDRLISVPNIALNSTTTEASHPPSPTTSATTTATQTTITTMTTRAATTTVAPPAPTTRTSHRPFVRRTTTTTTTRRPSIRTTISFKDDDLDGGDDDVITDLDVNNNINPTPGKDGNSEVSIEKHEEDTNGLLSNLPVVYRVSNLPKLAFLSQSGVLAGIIAGSIVVLLGLVLLIMFVVYHLKRKSEPAFDRSTRSPVKAGYKKALDKDMYG